MKLQARITALAVGVGLFALACDGASDALLEPPGPSFASGPGPVVESATGSGQYLWVPEEPPVAVRNFAFSAKKHEDGSVTGHAVFVRHDRAYPGDDPPEPSRSSWNKGNAEITCMTVIGNEAWMGGYMNSGLYSTPPPPPWDVGWEPGVFFYVKDNGQGANADPDVLSLIALQDAEDFCEDTPEDGGRLLTFDIMAGNIQVKP